MPLVYKSHPNLEGFWSLDETGGTRYDKSVNDNDLADNNTVGSSTDCQEGVRSADFESSNGEYLSIADGVQSGLDITGDLTLVAWIKPESTGANMALLSKWRTSGANQRSYVMRLDNSRAIEGLLSSNGVAVVTAVGSTLLNAGTWYHVAMVYNGTDIRVYVDGLLDANGANNPKAYVGGIHSGSSSFRLGTTGDAWWDYDGLMDEAAIFSYALGATEIASIHESGIPDSPRGSMAENALFLY